MFDIVSQNALDQIPSVDPFFGPKHLAWVSPTWFGCIIYWYDDEQQQHSQKVRNETEIPPGFVQSIIDEAKEALEESNKGDF